MKRHPARQTRACGVVDLSVQCTDSPASVGRWYKHRARAGTDQRSRRRGPRGPLAKIGSDLLSSARTLGWEADARASVNP